ncbi:rho GTPase-activating protein 26-like [Tropilaelaps mercedesae]|uniref:Rho GTPase-activating protein 26-like n=1 Tax=Tropilaelaps mercedesae TaxID=418985 RepID=A0A1V9XA48_9ACAR|nr:rho GTPase-activating protein 26-like [Tropilaelaps mercedesae]
MGLLPLEFRDCLTDSPQFRDNLASHEKELETTSQSIKGIIKEIKELLNAAKRPCGHVLCPSRQLSRNPRLEIGVNAFALVDGANRVRLASTEQASLLLLHILNDVSKELAV